MKEKLREICARMHAPGLALFYTTGSNRDFVYFGEADRAKGVAVTAATAFPVGCLIKLLIAEVTRKLHSLGKLDLHGAVSNFLNNRQSQSFNNFKDISIEMLLTHVSGIDDKLAYEVARTNAPSVHLEDLVAKSELLYKPGLFFSYSNVAYLILVEILERCTNSDLLELIRDFIGVELRLNDPSKCTCYIYSETEDDFKEDVYSLRSPNLAKCIGSTIYLTIGDLAQIVEYFKELNASAESDSSITAFFSSENKNLVVPSLFTGYGWGRFADNIRGFWSGSPTYQSHFVINFEDGTAFGILANSSLKWSMPAFHDVLGLVPNYPVNSLRVRYANYETIPGIYRGHGIVLEIVSSGDELYLKGFSFSGHMFPSECIPSADGLRILISQRSNGSHLLSELPNAWPSNMNGRVIFADLAGGQYMLLKTCVLRKDTEFGHAS